MVAAWMAILNSFEFLSSYTKSEPKEIIVSRQSGVRQRDEEEKPLGACQWCSRESSSMKVKWKLTEFFNFMTVFHKTFWGDALQTKLILIEKITQNKNEEFEKCMKTFFYF